MNDFEDRLTRELHQLVDGQNPSPEVRERIVHEISAVGPARSSRRRWLPAAAAALLVIAGIGALASTTGDDGGMDVATDPEQSSATADDDADDDDDDDDDATGSDDEMPVKQRATTTTAPTTVPPTDTTLAPDPAVQVDEAPAPPPDAAAPPTTQAPRTNELQCHNSTDPACGPFHWSPQPTNRPATLTIEAPDRIVVNQPVQLDLHMSDPDGPVTFGCYTVNLDRPGLSSGPCTIERTDCPARYGPWSPPPPKGGQATTDTSVRFHETGTYVITVDVDPADGCDNVDPYRSGATASLTVEVVAE